MARQVQLQQINSFIGGLVTEASPLTFPPNASLEEDNFVLLRNGSRRRRLGFDYEEQAVLRDTGIITDTAAPFAVSVHKWENINEDANVGLVVVQIGSDLYFYDLFASALSLTPRNGGNPLTIPASVSDPTKPIDVTNINGVLIVVNGSKFAHVLEYNSTSDTVERLQFNIQIRDLFGVDDGLELTTRPSSLSSFHKYNLKNQGWKDSEISSFRSKVGAYPSNADIIYFGKDTDQKFDGDLVTKQYFGSTPAPKGSFVIDAFDRGSSRAIQSSNVVGSYGLLFSFLNAWKNIEDGFLGAGYTAASAGLLTDSSTKGITTVATYAGRVFYSGAESVLVEGDTYSPQLGGFIFFSQLADNTKNFTKCYQEADPTSEHISDLIDTDGGFIRIPEAGLVLKLEPVADSLIVFAKNGVWAIRGGDSGFSATSYQVQKISSNGAISRDSIVSIGDSVFYWDSSGIYALVPDQITGYLSPQNISEQTIQTFYNSIPEVAKKTSRGVFDSAARQIRWMYNSRSNYTGVDFAYSYNKELVFDTVLKAFYTVTISDPTGIIPSISGYIELPGVVSVTDNLNVVVGSDEVIVGADDVIVDRTVLDSVDRSIKYFITIPNGTLKYTFGLYRNALFQDWETFGTPLDAPARLLTGYEILNNNYHNKEALYITTHFLSTERGFQEINGELELVNTSSCLLQAQWEWTNSISAGQWSTERQAYRLNRIYIPTDVSDPFDYGHRVITTKNKVRGEGRALSLSFKTEAQKDCHILGWSIPYSTDQSI